MINLTLSILGLNHLLLQIECRAYKGQPCIVFSGERKNGAMSLGRDFFDRYKFSPGVHRPFHSDPESSLLLDICLPGNPKDTFRVKQYVTPAGLWREESGQMAE